MIQIRGLLKSFGRRPVLQGVDLDVGTGETLVVIGGSGCGKSTLLKCVVGLIPSDGGTIIVDDRDLRSVHDEAERSEWRGKFGYLFQEGALFDSMSVWENVAFGLKYMTNMPHSRYRRIASEKLALVGLKDVEDLKPAQLSGGMKKRVALARAIAASPRYILYDEPTTGLDPIMSDVINNLVLDLQKKLGVTSIAVTHDMKSALKIATRIAMLHEGRVLAAGSPEEIRESRDPAVRQFIEGRSMGPIGAV